MPSARCSGFESSRGPKMSRAHSQRLNAATANPRRSASFVMSVVIHHQPSSPVRTTGHGASAFAPCGSQTFIPKENGAAPPSMRTLPER